MRIAIAGLMHESNTENPIHADRAAFVAQGLAFGPDLVPVWQMAHHEVAGFLESVAEQGFEYVPLVMAWATPSGPVEQNVFDEVVQAIIDGLKRERPDGLLLALHGAMVSTSCTDADAEVLARIRAAVGREFPIAVTFDLHGNLSPRLAELCDLALAYHTNPHVDQRARGRQAATLLGRWLRGRIRPRLALAKPNMLINIMKQDTSCPPLSRFMARCRSLEMQSRVLSVCLLPGFAYADVPHMGPTVLTVTDDDLEGAQLIASQVAHELEQARSEFDVRLPNAADAVAKALASNDTPVILVDAGDNVGGGSAGDGTVILHELLRQQATGFVVCLYAPGEVQTCQSAGVDGTVALTVGGKVDRQHGDPVTVSGKVRLLHDGNYIEEQVRHGGKRHNSMGATALVELPGDNLLVLTSQRHPPFSLGPLTCLGIKPEQKRILVVKAAIAYKAAYTPIAGTIIEVDTPGLTRIHPRDLA